MFNCNISKIDNNSLLIKGSDKELNNIRKYLTIINKSVSYRIRKVAENLERYDAMGKEWLVIKMSEELKELKEQEKIELYSDSEDGIIVPYGMYSIGKCDTPFYLNNYFQPEIFPKMRYYQVDAVNAACKYQRAMIQACTGSGKGHMISSIAIGAAKSGLRSIVVVPSEYLVGQMVEDISEHWDSVTGASGKRKPKLGTDILVVTANSAHKFIDIYDIVIFDEAHRMATDTYQDAVLKALSAKCIYTMTATPFRADGLDLILEALGGPVVYEYPVKKAIVEGFLTKPQIYTMLLNPGVEFGNGKLAILAYNKLVVNGVVFAALFTGLKNALDAGRSCIVMFKTVKAGEAFKKYCKGRIDFDVANGNYKKPLDDFKKGLTNILVACDKLIGEGVSINRADVLFLLTQHASDVMTYQCIGRVLRLSPGKEKATIIDIGVSGYKQFENSIKKRIKVYKDIITEENQLVIK